MPSTHPPPSHPPKCHPPEKNYKGKKAENGNVKGEKPGVALGSAGSRGQRVVLGIWVFFPL